MKRKRFLFLKRKNYAFSNIFSFSISKRQRFIIGVIVLALGLFFSEYQFGKSGFYIALFLSVLTDIFFIFALFRDLKGSFSVSMLILPFFYTLAFGLFYFLVPNRILTRSIMTILYGIGLYSLYLSQNIFIVASVRTIALLTGARLVSFVITLITYFFLSTVVFSLHLAIVPTAVLLFFFSFFLFLHAVWSVTFFIGLFN